MTYFVRYVPIDAFLVYLADGWTFPDDIAEPIQDPHHGQYSCILIAPEGEVV